MNRGLELFRNGKRPRHHLDEVVILFRHDDFKLIELVIGKQRDIVFRELPENEVHLANAAVPAAVKYPPASRIEVGTRAHQSSHRIHLSVDHSTAR